MVKLRPSDCFWIVVPIVAVVYNVFLAEEGDTLSEAWDRYLKRWPWLKHVIRVVSKHLANELDPRADPIGIGFVLIRMLFRRSGAVTVLVVDD